MVGIGDGRYMVGIGDDDIWWALVTTIYGGHW